MRERNDDTGGRPIRVLIADDEALVRAGIRFVLSHADDIDVVAEARNGTGVLDLVLRQRVDVVLMDIQMPGMDGLTATELMTARQPSVRVVVLTTFGEDDYVTRALAAGAAGFVLKDTSPTDLIQAVRIAASGDAILSPRVTRTLIQRYVLSNASRVSEARRSVALLTDRERDMLTLVGLGMSNADAGQRLFLTEGTIKTHVRHIL